MAIDNYLVTETGRITYDMTDRTFYASPWLTFFEKKFFPKNMGDVVSNVMFERPFVNTPVDFANVTLNNGSGNSCLPPTEVITFSQTLREYGLKHKAFESPDFCVNDMMFAGAPSKQMENIMDAMEEIVRMTWVDFNRSAYDNICTKYILDATLTNTGEGEAWDDTSLPTGYLTQDVLKYFYETYILEQGSKFAFTQSNGKPVLGLVTDMISSDRIIKGDADIREDYRNSSKKDDLLAPLGITHVYGGYIHLIDEMPDRYNWDAVNSEWDLVPRYVVDNTDPLHPTREVNPAWRNAEYQTSYILTPAAMTIRVPDISTHVGDADFAARDYTGKFSFKNIEHRTDNPDKSIGFFRSIIMAGHESVRPQLAIAIRHKVCPPNFTPTACDN